MTGVAIAILTALYAGSTVPAATPDDPTAAEVRGAMDRGADFLLKSQNADGSWGGPGGAIYTFTGPVWPNPETHRAWQVATTGLCCLALAEVGDSAEEKQALDRGLDYLVANAAVDRPNEWDTMNNWAYIYGLQAVAGAYVHPQYANSDRRTALRAAGQTMIEKLAYHQSINGGWGYLEFDVPRTRRPQWATSFMTASAVIALSEARRAGFTVDDAVVNRAVKAIEHCRLPNGAYTYSVPAIPSPRTLEWIDQVKGSLGRIQVCHAALLAWGRELPAERLSTGLDHLFSKHRFLDIARNRPIPHETFYYNSGYFYYYGHYYAAMVVEQLPPGQQARFWPKLQREIIKTQQKDGSMWDYDMHDYHKPYGVAYGLMALHRSLPPEVSVTSSGTPQSLPDGT